MACRAYPTVARDFGARTYSWEGVLPYASANGTTECLTATDGPYSFPTGVALPTDRVGELDTGDPRGLGYCYESDHYMPITDDLFWSPFQGTLLDALHNESNCKQETRAWAPAVVATQATFLLQTTTDFIDGPETKSPTPSAPIKESLTPTDVRVDPFQTESQSEDEQEPIPTGPAPDRTTPVTKQSLKAPGATANQINPPSKDDDKPKPFELHNARPTAPADEVSKSQAVESPGPTDEIPDPGDNPAPAPKTDQLEILNSLIQDVGQHRSSIKPTAAAGKDVPLITFNGITATPDSSSEYVIGEQTLKPGGPAITISGTQVSLAPGVSAIVIGSSTSILLYSDSPRDKAKDDTPARVLTLTGNPDSASEYIVADQTLRPGGSAITISGTPVSLDPEATALVVGSSTRPIAVIPYGGDQAQQEGVQLAAKPPARLTLAGTTATLNSASEYIIAGQTLIAGGTPITVSGTPISLASQATAVVIGTSTSILGANPHDGDQTQQGGRLPPVVTLAGATATLNSASEYVIEGQTPTPGGNAITVSGNHISLVRGATAVIIDSTTSALPAVSSNIRDYVWAGIAGVLAAAEASSTASPEASETMSRSEVVVTSTASDGEVFVETIFKAESTTTSPIDSLSSSAGASSLASGKASPASSSSSAGVSNVASAASTTKYVADLTALVFWVGIVTMFGM
jgi:hypothetical protein